VVNWIWKSLCTVCTTVYGRNGPVKSYDIFNPQRTCSSKWIFFYVLPICYDHFSDSRLVCCSKNVTGLEDRHILYLSLTSRIIFLFFFSPIHYRSHCPSASSIKFLPPESSTGQTLMVVPWLRSANPLFGPQRWQKIEPKFTFQKRNWTLFT
jgi:hypothetical protein